MAEWIIRQFPEHYCYVEPFCGSSAVLLNKPRSNNEVVNDLDGDIVQFFEVLRDRGDELADWLELVPYAKDVHQEWMEDYYNGTRSDDPIERAGRFFFLRYSQFSAKYNGPSGFASAAPRNQAQAFANKREKLREFSQRFEGVQIENRDYEYILDRFDSEDTLFYFDPPYVREGDALYTHGEFDHDRFVELVSSLDGYFAISYTDVPPALSDYHVVTQDRQQRMSQARDDVDETRRVESLVLNYDPDEEPEFVGAQQTQLGV